MGGHDSQKLRPWRGTYSSPGRSEPPATAINNLTQVLVPDAGSTVSLEARGDYSWAYTCLPLALLHTAWVIFGKQMWVTHRERRRRPRSCNGRLHRGPSTRLGASERCPPRKSDDSVPKLNASSVTKLPRPSVRESRPGLSHTPLHFESGREGAAPGVPRQDALALLHFLHEVSMRATRRRVKVGSRCRDCRIKPAAGPESIMVATSVIVRPPASAALNSSPISNVGNGAVCRSSRTMRPTTRAPRGISTTLPTLIGLSSLAIPGHPRRRQPGQAPIRAPARTRSDLAAQRSLPVRRLGAMMAGLRRRPPVFRIAPSTQRGTAGMNQDASGSCRRLRPSP